MLTFYSVENPINVHNGKKWSTIKDKDLRHCLTIDPAATDDVYSIVVFSSYEDALKAALDGVNVAPDKTAPNKKVSLTTKEQYPIFKWQFDGEESSLTEDSFELEDNTTIKALRVSTDFLTLVSASLEHVNPSRFKEVEFYVPEFSSEEENEESSESLAQAQPAQTDVVAKEGEENKAEQPPVQLQDAAINPTPSTVATAKPSALRNLGANLWSFGKGVVTRPSLWLGGAAALATEYGPQIIKDTIPEVPYVNDVVMAAGATAALVEATVGIKNVVQYCRKSAKQEDSVDAILAIRPKPITTARTLAQANTTSDVQSTPVVVEEKKNNKTGVRV